MRTTKKRRSDRNHIIYQITCNETDERYIGVTVMLKAAKVKTLERRWQGHLYKALVTREKWALPKAIRKYGPDAFSKEILQIVRGKKNAFVVEAELINSLETELNVRKKQ